MTTTAVIPIKQLSNAKQRLSGLLDPAERQGLFAAMVQDVLTAVEACAAIDQVLVVTDDDEVAELARSYGARIMPEPPQPGLIEAVTQAGRQLATEGIRVMVFLPGDVPLVSADELAVVLEGMGVSDQPEFLIVPAADLGGSNCVVVSPPDCMTFGFGEDSFRRHIGLAKERGINPMVAKLPGLGLDVDTPEDLEALMAVVEQGGRDYLEYSTVRFLTTSGIFERLTRKTAEQD